ncbi:uncharacterized protein KQ657_000414 [Scheffersomyces spartinae]|uniref:RNA helicase n=1 Tax=Scheffersomyces spartinae TaxID=45513 RepID=A0A9P8AII9_9ASCO|nr:uncharacterized protein KQ657_000414 [Scheffersomyces spartinae]KAG7193724.1 hypothetical protein KQ657_000414 [Scheffersomyces spartinae]
MELTGTGKRRRRSYSDDEEDEVILTVVESKKNETLEEVVPPIVADNSHEIHSKEAPKSKQPVNDTLSLNEARFKSRESYLQKRQQEKLQQLRQEINELESQKPALTRHQLQELQRKQRIFEAIESKRDKTSEKNEYYIPQDYVSEHGAIDKKRKRELLKPTYASAPPSENRQRYDNKWEQDQLVKGKDQLNFVPSMDEMAVVNKDNYEYVFDELQFIDFDTDETLEGDDNINDDSVQLKLNSIKETKESLPVFKYRTEFLKAVEDNQVVIIVGETGSGKTTQLPQYLYEAGYSKDKITGKPKIIACTQPRRVAAMSVAKRVAQEMDVPLGKKVGYTIRFEDNTNEQTIIKYMTDGMLLREFLTNPELDKYSCIMIDEAHERTLSTEIILSLLKDIILHRKDLKLLIASATINADKFSTFFNGAPIFSIPGRRFPVDIHYTKNPEANYVQAAITTIFQIHTTQELPGDILVFLTGQDEIELMELSLQEAISDLKLQNQLLVNSIYANLPAELQARIFEPTPPNCRKIILATNIAETSITIDGIKFVIDPGYVKQNVYNPVTGMESLVVVPCSRASANQRAGRAGRLGPGKCFRMYTKWSFYNELDLNPVPEILRVNLTGVVLLLLSLGVNDLLHFDFMDPPSTDSIIKSLELLYSLGALNSKGQLTKTGRIMVLFPLDAMFSKSLITSLKLGVLHDTLSILSMLSESGNLFYRPKDKREQADKTRGAFSEESGDHLTLLNIYDTWVNNGYSVQWCEDNFVQYKTLKRVRDIRNQLSSLCDKVGFKGSCQKWEGKADKNEVILRALVSGFFSNVVRLSKMGDCYRKLKRNQPLFLHPSSSMHNVKPPPKLLMYHELVLTSKEFMRNVTRVKPEWVKEFGLHYFSSKDLEFMEPMRK